MRERRTILVAGLGGVLTGLLVAGLLVADWAAEPEVIAGEEATEQFLEAWERSQWGTYYVQSRFHRVMSTGRELESTIEQVQRPPDRLRIQNGAVDGRLDGRPVYCSTDPDEVVACRLAETPPVAHEELVRRQMDAWETLLDAERPSYTVTAVDGCYELRLVQFQHEPPYGSFARFCFDAATGAIVETEVRRDEGTDFVEAVQVRAQVSDADFLLPS